MLAGQRVGTLPAAPRQTRPGQVRLWLRDQLTGDVHLTALQVVLTVIHVQPTILLFRTLKNRFPLGDPLV